MAFRLGDDEATGAGLKRILLEEIGSARAAIALPPSERSAGIHRARRAMKRARSVLRVFEPVLAKDYRRRKTVLAEVADLLSAARDADVALACAARLGGDDDEAGDGAGGAILATLRREAEAAHRGSLDLARAARALRIAEADAAGLPVLPDAGRLLVEAMAGSYRRGRRDWHAAEAGGDEEVLHDWRRQVKHRWHLSLLVPERTAVTTRAHLGDLDRLGELLGDEHDLALLIDRLDRDPDAAGGRKAARRLIERAEKRRRKLGRRALALGADLYGAKTRHYRAALEPLAAGR